MKKIIIQFFLFLAILFISVIIILSTVGVETNKFNNFISNKASQTKNINLKLNTIKFKVNPRELSLFLETKSPKIIFKDVLVPVSNIKVYVDFLSLLKSEPKIEKTNLIFEELDITQLNKLSKIIKPSNFKSLLNNKIKAGKLVSEIEIYLDEQGLLKNFIAKGNVKDLEAELINGFNLSKMSLSFFADRNDILIKNILGNLEDIKIFDGDIRLNLDNGIKLNSNFNSKIIFDSNLFAKYEKFLGKYSFVENISFLKSNFSNSFKIELDKTYKVKDYDFSASGVIEKSQFKLNKPLKNNFITEKIEEIYLSDLKFQTKFLPKKISFNGDGKYSFDNSNFNKINLINTFVGGLARLKLNFDFSNILVIDFINYKKSNNTIASISLDLVKKKNNVKINEFNYQEEKNLIRLEDLKIRDNNFLSFKKIKVATQNNDFYINSGKKIFIKGSKFDATNLSKSLDSNNSKNQFKNLNGNIEIDFQNIKIPMSEKLENFKLIGEIEKGKFTKISSKGDFGGENYLDISMKRDKKSNKKFLEIYSDLTRPLLSEYSFFNGLSGGKLLFSSIIDDSNASSKLKIENFKVVNAPGVIKLLSLADLGGLADLAEGEGLSFDILEIEMEKNKKFLKLNEILALGPSMSVLMEGYQDESGLTSLRGTLVPAKTLNKMISKIPVIGDIVIPKEIGEGLFGISFKMKGPKGKIKTTINPIRTLTPRFIQKIVDRNKTSK